MDTKIRITHILFEYKYIYTRIEINAYSKYDIIYDKPVNDIDHPTRQPVAISHDFSSEMPTSHPDLGEVREGVENLADSIRITEDSIKFGNMNDSLLDVHMKDSKAVVIDDNNILILGTLTIAIIFMGCMILRD
jgi:hypothetical protein